MDVLNHAHFKEEQRAYYQGMMDAVQLLGGLNLLKVFYPGLKAGVYKGG